MAMVTISLTYQGLLVKSLSIHQNAQDTSLLNEIQAQLPFDLSNYTLFYNQFPLQSRSVMFQNGDMIDISQSSFTSYDENLAQYDQFMIESKNKFQYIQPHLRRMLDPIDMIKIWRIKKYLSMPSLELTTRTYLECHKNVDQTYLQLM